GWEPGAALDPDRRSKATFASAMRVLLRFRVLPRALYKQMGAPFDAPLDLFADSEPVDQLAVPDAVLRFQVVEQPPPLADQLEQAPARVVRLLVLLEVLGAVVDAFVKV